MPPSVCPKLFSRQLFSCASPRRRVERSVDNLTKIVRVSVVSRGSHSRGWWVSDSDRREPIETYKA